MYPLSCSISLLYNAGYKLAVRICRALLYQLMSHKIVRHMTTDSAEATERFAEAIGKRLRGGEVIELASDLGGGKTTFVRGLARGMGSGDRVASPTFTISREYRAGKLTLHHFDFYRLHEAGIVAAELAEVAHAPYTVVVVEWGDIVRDVLPERKITIHNKATGEEARHLTLAYPESLSYVFPKEVKC